MTTIMTILPIVLVIGMNVLFRAGIATGLHRLFGQQDENGRLAERTTLGKLGFGNLDLGAEFIARQGINATPRMSLNTTILRPTIGLRIMSVLPAALLMWVTWGPTPMIEGWLALLVTASTLYGVIYTNNYELRYDGDGVTAPDWLFRQRQFNWVDFQSIRDNGHYLYNLRFGKGKKLSVQKHLVGIRAFLTFVQEVEDLNARVTRS